MWLAITVAFLEFFKTSFKSSIFIIKRSPFNTVAAQALTTTISGEYLFKASFTSLHQIVSPAT